MTDERDEHLPDLDDMPIEGLHEMIHDLHDAYHAMEDRAGWFEAQALSAASSMLALAAELDEANKLGKRRRAMDMVTTKLQAIGAMMIIFSGADLEKIAVDSEFADIAERLEADGIDSEGGDE